MTRKALGVLAAAAMLGTLAGCSSDDAAEREPRAATSTTASEPLVVLRMVDACRFVQEAIDETSNDEAGMQELSAWTARLAEDADAKTRDALLRIASAAASQYQGKSVDDVLARQEAYSDALDNMAAECKAVGSSALQ